MSRIIFFFLFFPAFTKTAIGQVVIRNTNVVDVINRKILSGYDVVTRNGQIASVQKTSLPQYLAGETVIDGTGKYLIPGFCDAHVHFFQSGSMFARPDAIDLRKSKPYADEIKYSHDNMEDFLRRYTAAGITSVIDVGSTYSFLDQRDSFANKPYAPQVAMTGALLTTYIPPAFKDVPKNDIPFIMMRTDDSVRLSVRELKAGGADFIKIWYIVLDADKEKGARKNLPLVQAVIDEAHKNNMRVAVHATERITAQLAVEAGADYLVHNVEDEVLTPAFVQLLKNKQVVLCPTMVVAGNYRKAFGHNYHFTADELSIVNPFTAGTLIDFPLPDTSVGNRYIRSMNSPRNKALQAHTDSVLSVNLKMLQDGGVTIATGTDAGNIGTQHAGSFFNELKAMKDAGLDMWDLLVNSTINGAKAMGNESNTGSVTKGKTADMVLLNANPLDSLTNWRTINYVINRGIAMRPSELLNNSPEMVVQQQLDAYNLQDMDAFLNTYDDSIKIYDLKGHIILKNKADMRRAYSRAFLVPGTHCRLLNRMLQGNNVVDHEEITVPGGPKPFYGIVLYRVEKGKIISVSLVRE